MIIMTRNILVTVLILCRKESHFGNLRERRNLENLDVDGRKIKVNIQELEWKAKTDSSGSEREQVAKSCEHGNELSNSIKCVEFRTS